MAIFEVQGIALTFYIIPCKKKAALSKAIKDNGGEMAIQRRQSDYQLYNSGDIVSNPEMVSSKFIEDCVEQKKLLDVEEYRYTSQQKKREHKDKKKPEEANFAFDEPSTSRITQSSSISSQRRAGFSIQEDMAIIRSVLKLSKTHSVNGNKLWEIMTSEKVTNRSSLSMKERFIKKILPYISNYDLEDKELRKLKTLQSSKSFKVAKKAGVTQRRKELDFLRAPRPVDPHSVFDLSSSSSSEGEPSRLNHSVVNKALVKRKKLVELSSNSSDSPSSQSQSQENNNQSTVTRGNNAVSDQPGRLKKMLIQLGYTQADKVAASRSTDKLSASNASTSKKNVDSVESDFSASTGSSPEPLVSRFTNSNVMSGDTTKGKTKEQCGSDMKSKTGSGSKHQPKKAVGTSSILMSDNSQETQNSQRSKSSQESKESRRSTRSSTGSYVIQDSSPDIQDGKRARTNRSGLTDDDLALLTSPVVKQPTTLSTRLSEKCAESTSGRTKRISATSTPQKSISTRKTPHTSKDDTDGQISVQQEHKKSSSTDAKDSASTTNTKDQTMQLSKLETVGNVTASPRSAFRVTHKVKTSNDTSDFQKVSPKVKVTRSSNRNQSNNQSLAEAATKSDDIFPSTQPFTVEDESSDSPNKKKTRTLIEQSQEKSSANKEIGSDVDNENSIFPCTQPFTVSTESDPTTDTESPDPEGVHNVSAGTPIYDIETSTQPFVVLEDISKLSDSLNSIHVPEGLGVNNHNESPRRSVRISHQINEDECEGKGNNSKIKQPDELVKDSQSPANNTKSQGSNKSNIESQQSNQSSILCDLPLAQLDKRYSPALETQNSDSSVEFICETKRRSDTPEVPPPAPPPAPHPTCIPTSSQFAAGDADSQLLAKPLSSSTQVEHVPPPITESDERFRSDLLSDTYMASDDDVWPCASPPVTPADPEQQHKASSQPAKSNKQDLKAKPTSKSSQICNDKASTDVVSKNSAAMEKANDNITSEKRSVHKEVTTNNLEMESMPPPAPRRDVTKVPDASSQHKNEDTQSQQDKLSWSTFDFNTQKSDDLSGNSSNGGHSNQPDGASTLPTGNELPSLPNIEHSPLNSRKRKYSTGSGIDNFVLPNAVKQLISNCDFPSLSKPSVQDDVVNQSWSERSDSCSPPAQLGGPSPTVSPPRSPKRKCRLGDIVQQPLHKPEYADANSTLNTTLTQESKYVDCESRCESEDSFASAKEEPIPKVKEDTSLLIESKNCDEQSNSIVKTEALSPKKTEQRVRSPKKASMVLQSDQPVASTSTANTEPAVSLFINKCDSCQADTKGKAQCLIEKIKSDENYSKLMMTHRIEDESLFGYVVGLSADWELIDQHFKSGLKVGKLWTEKDDRLLMSSFNIKKNKQLLKRRFTDREMKNRRTFLLEYTDISAKQRAALLGMG